MMDFMSVHQPQLQFPADHASGSSSAAHNAYGLFEGGFSAFLDTNAFNQFYSNMTLHQSHENVHQSGFVNILCSAPSFLSGTIDQGCFSHYQSIARIPSPLLPGVPPRLDRDDPLMLTPAEENNYDGWCRIEERRAPKMYNKENDHLCDQAFFNNIEDLTQDFDDAVVDMYMGVLRLRLVETQDGLNVHPDAICIVDSSFFDNVAQPWGRAHSGNICYHDGHFSNASKKLLSYVMGYDTGSARQWHYARKLIIPCYILKRFVVVHVDLVDWAAVVYDPLYHGANKDALERRRTHLRPLTRTLLEYLKFTSYWHQNTIGAKMPNGNPILLITWVSEHFKQKDHISSRVIACMTVERIICGRPSIRWGDLPTNRRLYRRIVAAKLWGHCYTGIDD